MKPGTKLCINVSLKGVGEYGIGTRYAAKAMLWRFKSSRPDQAGFYLLNYFLTFIFLFSSRGGCGFNIPLTETDNF
ncbi:MAG: hypothetical protein WD035_02770 [Balneolaceae bacterium]